MSEHGGDLDKAIQFYGGKKCQWIDLSTGINPNPYPIPKLKITDWQKLPTLDEIESLEFLIKSKFKTSLEIALVSGAQTAINFLPFLLEKRSVNILVPTYNEYQLCFQDAGWNVRLSKEFNQLFSSEVVIIVNPNNPDGKTHKIKDLINLSKSVDILIIDESFIDLSENKSIISEIDSDIKNIIVIRSFGKFFGLAGMRLGFILSNSKTNKKLKRNLGPWPVSKMSIKIAEIEIQDNIWIRKNSMYLNSWSISLDQLMEVINWKIIGGTNLFRLYSTPNSDLAQKFLAESYIWSRKFSYSKKWLRLGIPCIEGYKRLKKIVESLKV